MQFPYPRKSSPPPPREHRHTPSTNFRRRKTLKNLATYLFTGVTVVFFLLWLFPGRSSSGVSKEERNSKRPAGTPEVVIVTTLDPKLSPKHRENIIDNRLDYAARHGYGTFFPNTTDYDLMPGVPHSWSTIPAMRHAMTLNKHTPWVWYLSNTALIMNPTKTLQERMLDPEKLESLMIVDQPVVPPDSIIKTFSHLRPERVDLILSQDTDGLAGGSILLRTGEWAKFFLDAWYDPLYRSYNFQKAEAHALEHLIQWHSTVLAKLALVPQKTMNSYSESSKFKAGMEY